MTDNIENKPDNSLFGANIVLGVTGSIAAYKAADLVSKLKQKGTEVHTVLTASAREFIAPLTFETLSGNQVYTDLFGLKRQDVPVHISLAGRADLMVIAPATANFIGKIASGLADDLLSSVMMATRAPVLIAPAMNSGMYENRIVQENIRRLEELGMNFIGPESGYLACGYEGSGRLADVKAIIAEIKFIRQRNISDVAGIRDKQD
ncbi:MAG: flavoprotein [Candidatus Auribacterota bacterium]|nr:flavoprotein [Candidatus Auribacterota bacterium]